MGRKTWKLGTSGSSDVKVWLLTVSGQKNADLNDRQIGIKVLKSVTLAFCPRNGQ